MVGRISGCMALCSQSLDTYVRLVTASSGLSVIEFKLAFSNRNRRKMGSEIIAIIQRGIIIENTSAQMYEKEGNTIGTVCCKSIAN